MACDTHTNLLFLTLPEYSNCRRFRRQLPPGDLKKGARRPWKRMPIKHLLNHLGPAVTGLTSSSNHSSNGSNSTNNNNNNEIIGADEELMQVAE